MRPLAKAPRKRAPLPSPEAQPQIQAEAAPRSVKSLVITWAVPVVLFSLLILGVVLLQRRSARKAREANLRKVQRQAENPLEGCWICTACGWFGRGIRRPMQASGSSGSGCLMGLGIGCGGFLILIGLPMLVVFGVGVVPILVGVMLIITSIGTAATTSSQDALAHAVTWNTPHGCPSCRNHALIPATSPNGIQMLETTPALSRAATEEIERTREQARLILEGDPSSRPRLG